ncbi:MAG: NUDIX hydrolase [Planctomycetota bacterium]|nr:NUDIX hydrolase [Planctomycetota bacterium]
MGRMDEEGVTVAKIMEPDYCIKCAGSMEKKVPKGESRERSICSECGYIHYLDPKIACGTIPEYEGKLVLIRRKIDPRAGYWSFPCGFMEIDETTSEAAIRETKEETGLEVKLQDHLGTYSYTKGWWGGSVVIVAYTATILSDPIPIAGDDAAEARFFSPSEIPWDDLAFKSSTEALRDWGQRSRKS